MERIAINASIGGIQAGVNGGDTRARGDRMCILLIQPISIKPFAYDRSVHASFSGLPAHGRVEWTLFIWNRWGLPPGTWHRSNRCHINR